MRNLALMIALAFAHPAQADISDTQWLLTEIDSTAVAFSATLDLSEPGRASGKAPCNRYFGDLLYEAPNFQLGPVASTKMACADLMAENLYFDLLAIMDRIDLESDRLTLTGSGHILVFAPLEP